jgi:hypothetical protein
VRRADPQDRADPGDREDPFSPPFAERGRLTVEMRDGTRIVASRARSKALRELALRAV